MTRVCILGAALDTGNMGVSALGESVIALVRREAPDAEILFFAGRRTPAPYCPEIDGLKMNIGVVNFRMSPMARFGEHLFGLVLMSILYRSIPIQRIRGSILRANSRLKVLSEVDIACDIRGGDSFSDIYGLQRLIFGSLPAFVILMLGKRLVFLPQTYGPYRSLLSRQIARFLFRRAEIILSRDYESIRVVEELLVRGKNRTTVRFCPDVAICLNPATSRKVEIRPPLPETADPIFGLNVSGLLFNGGFDKRNTFGLRLDYRAFVHSLVLEVMRRTTARILLVPHTFAPPGDVESDPEACEMVIRKLGERYADRIHRVEGIYGPAEMKGIIGQCNFFVGSRMHACIASLSQGIPTIGVAYSRKFRGVFGSLGLGQMVVDALEMDHEAATEKILHEFLEGDRNREERWRQICLARERVRNIFRDLLTIA